MRMRQHHGLWLVLVLVLSVSLTLAQGTCPELVERALQEVDSNCAGIGRNEACYGYNRVEASFAANVADDFFSQPADLTAVEQLQTIRTAPLDLENDQWGVAVMSLQANLPNTIPGQNVTFVLLGDAEVENAVAPDQAFQPADGVEIAVSVAAGANVRSGPGTNFNVIGAVERNASVQADGISTDGEWLRVAYLDRPGWISRSLVTENEALAALPTLTDDLRTPMQAFYLRTGIGEPACEEAPDDILLVQGPKGIEIELTVNGANIALGSSGALRVVEIDGQLFLEVIVFDGVFVIKGEPPQGNTIIRAGYRSLMCLGDENSRGLDGIPNDLVVTCAPTEPERIDYEIFGADWCVMEKVPASILHYPLSILCPGEALPPTGGGGAATDSQIAGVDCASFALIGPFSGITPQPTTFSWTPAPGATDYEVVFYNYQGGVAQTFFTKETSITLNVGEIPTGSELSWEVRAYQNGAYACVTARTPTITRLADPNARPADEGGQAPADSSGMRAFVSACNTTRAGTNATVTWTGAPAAADILVTATGSRGTPVSSRSTGAAGSLVISISLDVLTNMVFTARPGGTINLINCP